jgi:DNA-binding NtrC family response regulator
MKTILIVDDEPAARYGLRRALESKYRIAEADSAEAARDALLTEKPDLVLLDVVLPGQDGLSFLKWVREQGNNIPVLMISALDAAKTAVDALRLGAADYLVKGFELDELRQRVANLLKLVSLEQENDSLRRQLATEGQFGGMIGRSEEMRRAFEIADRVAPTDSTVLILGESGTGKDLLAQEIHARSPRSGKPFVAVNCAALPETLIESELFGYERGAFTGAAQQRRGKFEQAHGGTLFLDEIGELAPDLQVKLLRVLQDKEFQRVGGVRDIRVDVRILAATNRDLHQALQRGTFREDLYYRLNVVAITLPALHERRADIPAYVQYFIAHYSREVNRPGLGITQEAVDMLQAYRWPGNVRELQNAIERAVVLTSGPAITPADFPAEIRPGVRPFVDTAPDTLSIDATLPLNEAVEAFKRARVRQALMEAGGNQREAAKLLGVQPSNLSRLMSTLGLR